MDSIEKVKRGLSQFLESELVGKMSGWQKVLAGTMIGVAMTKAENIAQNSFVQTMGICSGDQVDTNLLMEHLRNNIPPEGIEIPFPLVGNVRFRRNDVDILAEYIHRA